MVLTARDLSLLAHVARHRFLTSAQLAALDGGSTQNILRSLRLLFDHGYLDRPAAHLATVPLHGTRPLVYGLGQRGARALRSNGHSLNDRLDWTEKNKRAGATFVEHTLAVADFMVALELACRSRSDVELIREPEIIASSPQQTAKAREPLRWQTARAERGRTVSYSVVPDGLFALAFPDGTSSYFLLEIDRGTIPIKRGAAWRKSIAFKLATYFHGWRAGRHVEQFGVKQMRVVFLTSSAARVSSMLAAVDEITDGRGSAFFIFGHRDLLQTVTPLEAAWTDGKGNAVKLTD